MKPTSIVIAVVTLMILCGGVQAQPDNIDSDPDNTAVDSPIVVGKSYTFRSSVFAGEMNISISVSLPDKYLEEEHSYPVVYVLEGDYLFDATRSISTFMARRSHMPSSIVVGIEAGTFEHRKNMAVRLHGGQPDKYVRFLKNELIPYIAQHYRANSHRTLVGLSPTNGVVFDAFLNEPGLFRAYIALATHFEWPPEKDTRLIDELISRIKDPGYPETVLYMGRADSDLESSQYVQRAFDDAINKLGKVSKSNVISQIDVLNNEEHYLMSLAGLRRGFRLIFPYNQIMYSPTVSTSADPAKTLKQEYQRRSTVYGFDVYPAEDGYNFNDHLLGLVTIFEKASKYAQAIDMLNLTIDYYPNSANAHMRLAKIYHLTNDKQKAIKYAEKAIYLAKQFHPVLVEQFNNQLSQFNRL
ncbi:alpha/beta hydrolase-fold protein [Neptunicella sp. SCSIO 80796]|uniref:alpha/beta hydrolase-fold protein n=1 Tax=Neptunicella plasticusilytica TaxID=3117012 RepID=UPI003A4DE2FC